MNLNTLGLILDFIGVVILLYVMTKTKGATTQADEDYLISPWLQIIGYLILAFGFLLQIIGNIYA